MILISGASGFIGRRLAVRLAAERPAEDLRCLVGAREDAFCQTGTSFLRSRSLQPIPAELENCRGLEGLQSPGLVFHLAANTHTWESDHRCNDEGTQNLLRALAPLGPETHFVFTSTTAVMDNRNDLEKPLLPIPKVVSRPLSQYGVSKWRAEEFLRAEAKKQGFRLSIVRLCTVYGPQPRPNTLFDVLKGEVANQSLVSRLNWPGLTSFIHVDDVVNCLSSLADNPPEPGETRTYLLASESKTLAEVARLLYRVQGLTYRAIALPRAAWRLLRHSHRLSRWGATRLPVKLYNALWRFDIAVNPVFHCDTNGMATCFPGFAPRRMADCIAEI
jgi:nucleoside-diphosphate-sugar epimerase